MQSFAIGSNLDLTACLVSNIGKVTTTSQDNENNLSIEAGSIQAELGGRVDIQEKIKITSGLSTITAEEASYDETAGVLQIPKSVVFENPDLIIFGESAKLLTKEKTTIIDGADYQILSIPARGTARQIRVENGANIELDEVTYSTCTSVDNSWELSAKKIVINNQSGEGEARNLVLRFKDIPIIYLPYLSFPINDQRKTGLLVPNLGLSSKRGLEISLPYYWNLAPNIDLTTTPTLMAKRGVQLSAELRFLTAIQGGTTQIDYLPNDDKYKKDRTYISHRQTINLPSNWRMKLNGEYASDNSYFEDLTGTMSSTSRTHLLREIQLEHFSENWIMEIGMDHYQMIDDSIIDEEKPYRRLPYFNFSGMWGNKALGLNYALNSEVVFFDKPETISGSRFHVMPEVSAPLNFNGIKITPSMAMDFTKYNLHTANDNSHSMSSVSPERAVPIYSLDLTGVFQKTWKNGRYLQTLEPRILRVYVPYRNQDDFPIFDTIVPDMNGIQLFRKNRYVGQDRLGDTSQISYGITTKVVDANNGNSLFGLTLGQIRYFKDRKVALPSESKLTQDSSGYMAMMNMKINKNWSVKLGHMWNTHSNTSMKTTARFQYKSKQSEIFNVAYRYRRNMLKQLDASFSWPVRDHWNVVGRYNYSILDRKVLEQFVGLEYESCCWGIRVISRKHLAYRNGDTDTSFSIEFVFKGLSDIGDPVENLLDRGILGYDLE
jgi:LPS-assembly protein